MRAVDLIPGGDVSIAVDYEDTWDAGRPALDFMHHSALAEQRAWLFAIAHRHYAAADARLCTASDGAARGADHASR